MPTMIEGETRGSGLRIGIVVSRFNEPVSKRLLEGALKTLRDKSVPDDGVLVAWVPGAFEIPTVASQLAATGKLHALIALGAVIRGETPHFDYICAAVADGLAAIGSQRGLPCLFGVLTCDTLEQAMERSGGKSGNKGSEAALGAVEMASLLRKLREI